MEQLTAFMIKCTVCKKPFPQKRFERRCPLCSNNYNKDGNQEYFRYWRSIHRYWQNPIYQYLRLQNDEDFIPLELSNAHGII